MSENVRELMEMAIEMVRQHGDAIVIKDDNSAREWIVTLEASVVHIETKNYR
jgi:hypothetical protein